MQDRVLWVGESIYNLMHFLLNYWVMFNLYENCIKRGVWGSSPRKFLQNYVKIKQFHMGSRFNKNLFKYRYLYLNRDISIKNRDISIKIRDISLLKLEISLLELEISLLKLEISLFWK